LKPLKGTDQAFSISPDDMDRDCQFMGQGFEGDVIQENRAVCLEHARRDQDLIARLHARLELADDVLSSQKASDGDGIAKKVIGDHSCGNGKSHDLAQCRGS
jgi:hypothetical protein